MRRTLALIAGVVASVLIIAGIGIAASGDPTSVILPDDGSVTVRETDTGVTFDIATDLVLGTDWFLVEDESTDSEVEVKISNGSTTLKFEAGLEDGSVETEIEDVTIDESDDDGDDDDSDDGSETKSTTPVADFTSEPPYVLSENAGTVTVTLEDGVLFAVATLNTGWTEVTDDDDDSDDDDEISLKFTDGSIVIEFEAELEHGQVKVEIEVDDESDDHGDKSDDRDDDDSDDDKDDDD